MAEIKREEHSDNPIEKIQPNNDQEWFDSQGDYDSGETLKARSWETEHRLADDNSALGNIHQGTDEAQDFQKGEDTSIHFVTDPQGIELPEEPDAQEKALPGELSPSVSPVAVDNTGGVDPSPLPNSGGEYQAPDFSDLSIQAITDRMPELGVEQNGTLQQQNSGRQSAGNDELVRPEPTAALISGEGGLVVENAQNTVSGQLTIIDPDPGDASFQAGVVKGNYGSFDLAIDGSWFYRLAISQENVQSLANGELVSEVIEISSVDGTTHQLEITVRGTNDAPVFTSVTAQSFTEDDQIVSGQISAIDIDHGDVITFSTDTVVSGLQINADGSYQFDPGHADYQHLAAGDSLTLTVPVTATDLHGAGTTEMLTITVQGSNDGPVLDKIESRTVVEDDALILGQVAGVDLDRGDQVTYSTDKVVSGFEIKEDGSYQFDPGHADYQHLAAGDSLTLSVPVTATDLHGAGTTEMLTITVQGSNDGPVLDKIESRTVVEDDALILGQVTGADIDRGDQVTYSTDKVVSGFEIREDGSYQFDPGHADYQDLAAGDSLTLSVPVTATDLHGAGTTEMLTITVQGSNDGPVLDKIESRTVVEDDALILGQVTGADIDRGDQVTYSTDKVVSGFEIKEDGSYQFDPGHADYQHLAAGDSLTLSVPVTATDLHGAGTTEMLTITVQGSNDGPVLDKIESRTVVEDDALILGQVTGADIDRGDQVTYSTDKVISGLQFNADGSYQFDPGHADYQDLAAGDSLTLTVPVTATDLHGAGTTEMLTITVQGSNDGPVLDKIESRTVVEDDALILGQVAGADLDRGDQVTYSTDKVVSGFEIKEDGSYQFDPGHADYQHLAAGDSLTLSVPVTATDLHGAGTTEMLTITVQGSNDGPVLDKIESRTVVEDDALILGQVTGADIDRGDQVTYSTDKVVSGFEIREDGSYQFDPGHADYQDLAAGDSLTLSVPVTATDLHGAGTTEMLTITVQGSNDGPVLDKIESRTVVEDDALILGQVAGVDIDRGDQVTYSTDKVVSGFEIKEDGSYQFDPGHADYQHLGTGESMILNIPITATDLQGAETQETLVFRVIGTNEAPTISFGNYQEVLQESFENFRSSDGWHIEKGIGADNEVTGDHGVLWSLTDEGLEVQRGSIGGSRASDGESHIEMDGHANLSLSTKITTIEDQNYTVSFAYKARPGKTDSSDIKVSFGGRELHIDTDATDVTTLSSEDNITWQVNDAADGWKTITASFPDMDGGNESELVFTGTGKSDSLGAYVDDIHLGYSIPADQYITSFVEGGIGTPIVDNQLMSSDVDDNVLEGATVVLTNGTQKDQLLIGELPDELIALTTVSPEGVISLQLTGSAPFSTYHQAFQQIRFASSSDSPDTTNRFVEITVTDGQDHSNTLVTEIAVTAVENEPIVDSSLFSNHSDNISLASADPDYGANKIYDALDGNDTVIGGDGSDIIVGGRGDDRLSGGEGDDTFRVSGNSDGYDILNGGTGRDRVEGSSGDDVIGLQNFGASNSVEEIDGAGGENVIQGSTYANLDFSATELTNISEIRGGGGHNTITGSSDSDVIVGGRGDDRLSGGEGDDTFRVSGNSDGYDILNGGTGRDRVEGSSGDDVIGLQNFGASNSVEEIDGAGGDNVIQGSTYANLDFSATELTDISEIRGGGGHNTITGSSAGDVIVGGRGDDRLSGGEGDDTFRVSGNSDGYDILNGGTGTDRVEGGSGDDVIGLQNFGASNSVEEIDGAGGENVIQGSTYANLDFSETELTNISEIRGGGGHNTITGSSDSDVIVGGRGDDRLSGGEGDDTFRVSGNSDGYDILNGGTGRDRVEGSVGDDVIGLQNFGANNSVEEIDGAGGDNVIQGSTYANLDFSATELTDISEIRGGGGHNTITGSSAGDVIVGGRGDDRLSGGEGDDTFRVSGNSDGYDILNGGTGRDRVEGGSGDDVIGLQNFGASNSVEEIDGAGGDNVIQGSTYANLDFSATELTNISEIRGGGGHNTITGSSDSDVIVGGRGDDRLSGGEGDDTFRVSGNSDGYDILNGGTGTDRVEGSSGDDVIGLQNFGASNSVEEIDGAGGENVIQGSTYANLDFSATELTDISEIRGGGGHNTITGSSAGDVIVGGRGDDRLSGGEGDDTFRVSGNSDGYDILNGGTGTDRVEGSSGDDVIGLQNFGASNSIEEIDGAGGENVIQGSTYANLDFSATELTDISEIRGGGGHNTITGSSDSDVIVGGRGDDRLSGGGGNDLLDGGSGNDTALFRGSRDQYSFAVEGQKIIVTDDVIGRDGATEITQIENLLFVDGVLDAASIRSDELPQVVRFDNEVGELVDSGLLESESKDFLMLLDIDPLPGGGNILVEGVPPGSFLSAGEMIGGGEPADYQATTIGISQDSQARVVFEREDAGYRSSLGYYKIDSESGKISEVEMMWDNASLQGSGGSLIGGESAIDLDISAGDQIGFFLVADGSRKNNFGNLGDGHYEFQENDGSDATITSTVPKLIFVGEDGSETQISGHIYHSGESDENYSLNPDGMKHANGELDLDNGSITIGFEDLKGGGDQDYNDSIFTVEIGVENTQALADENAGFSTWQVEPGDIEGLTLTIPSENNEPFDLSVSSVGGESTSESSSMSVSINFGAEGPYVLEPEPSVELQNFDVQGVSLAVVGNSDQGSGQADLESFAATEANGQSGLPESLNQFSSTENGIESEDVPSLDEQAAAFEQEIQEQQCNGLGEQDMIINDDNDGITGGQEDQPIV